MLISDGNHSIVIFNYGNIEWTTGIASGGTAGLGGIPAQVWINLDNWLIFCSFIDILVDHTGWKNYFVLNVTKWHTCWQQISLNFVLYMI